MPIVVEATDEDGVLKPAQPLRLDEHEKVRVTIEPEGSWVDRTYGLLRWSGAPETLRRIAEDPDFGTLESP